MAKCIFCGRTLSGFTLGRKICVWCKQHEAAQRGEESAYQPVMATPWQRRDAMPMLITQLIFGINVAVFIGMLLSGASPMGPSGSTLLAWGANYGLYTLTGEWWRLLTSCFVHGGIIHLVFNMWCLWSLGGLAERLYGRATYACVYLLCGISGSLASVLWHGTPTVSVGASGAIFGIAGAVIASIKLGEFSSGTMADGVMKSLIGFVGFNVIFGVITGASDNACHIGGLLAGAALGAIIAKLSPESRLMPRLGVFVLVAALLAGGAYALQRSRAYGYYLIRASQQIQEGRTEAAIPFLEGALKIRPGSDLIHYHLAHAYRTKKDFASAERELQKVQEVNPANAEVIYALGSIRLDQHRLDDARKTFTQLLALDTQSAKAHLGLGAVAFEQGDCTLANAEYEQARQLNSRLLGVHAKQGACFLQLKQYDEAIGAFHKEIELSGDNAAHERLLAEAYRGKGMSAEADAALQKAEKLK